MRHQWSSYEAVWEFSHIRFELGPVEPWGARRTSRRHLQGHADISEHVLNSRSTIEHSQHVILGFSVLSACIIASTCLPAPPMPAGDSTYPTYTCRYRSVRGAAWESYFDITVPLPMQIKSSTEAWPMSEWQNQSATTRAAPADRWSLVYDVHAHVQ